MRVVFPLYSSIDDIIQVHSNISPKLRQKDFVVYEDVFYIHYASGQLNVWEVSEKLWELKVGSWQYKIGEGEAVNHDFYIKGKDKHINIKTIDNRKIEVTLK